MDKEFKIGDTVTLDRYNHIDDVERVKIVGYGETISKQPTYKMRVNDITIESIGTCIMESKFYDPIPKEERHRKMFHKDPAYIENEKKLLREFQEFFDNLGS